MDLNDSDEVRKDLAFLARVVRELVEDGWQQSEAVWAVYLWALRLREDPRKDGRAIKRLRVFRLKPPKNGQQKIG